MRNLYPLAVLIACGALLTSCELLDEATGGGARSPTMTYQEATLLQAPSTSSLLAYYCPASFGASSCAAAFGPAPAKEDLRFDFELNFQVDNPNRFDIPTLSMLLGTTLFQNDPSIQELGAVCVKFCKPGETDCGGVGADDACASDQQDLDSLEDFGNALGSELVNIATGETDPDYGDNLGVRTIPALGSNQVKVVFTLGLDPMTAILERVATDAAQAWFAGQEAPLEIPYAVRGTLWVDVPLGLGRVGLPFGPAENAWQLDL